MNRVIRWEEDGLEWEADQRHAELIISQLDLSRAKPVVTPGVKDEGKPKEAKEQEDEIVDFVQGQMYQNEGRIRLEEELNFIQESEVAETMEQQGWRRTSMGAGVQTRQTNADASGCGLEEAHYEEHGWWTHRGYACEQVFGQARSEGDSVI